MNGAIFSTTSHALHVSYLVMAHEPRRSTALWRALLQVMEGQASLTRIQRDWMDRLRGGRGSVDFGGLSGEEIRAQCALVCQAVNDHLPAPERALIRCKYGIQIEKAHGVAELAQYLTPSLPVKDEIAVKALVYGHLTPHQREKGFSYAEISRSQNVPVISLRRAAATIAQTAERLEVMAIDRLAPMFLRDGLIAARDDRDAA
ncbi:MAG TPA: hypothetical protein VF472_21770 [Burkholderiaceae bacterium]